MMTADKTASLPRRALRLLVLYLFAAIVPVAGADPSRPLVMTFATNGAVVDGVTPGGVLVVFARARKQIQLHYGEAVSLKFLMTDKTGSGRVVIDTGRELPADAVWAVVDLETGRHLITTRGAARERLRLPAGIVRHKPQDQGRLFLGMASAEMLVVRTGDGAWIQEIGDGAGADEDGRTNGAATISPVKMKNLRKKSAKQLDKVKKGDLVVVIDPRTLQVWSSTELGE